MYLVVVDASFEITHLPPINSKHLILVQFNNNSKRLSVVCINCYILLIITESINGFIKNVNIYF